MKEVVQRLKRYFTSEMDMPTLLVTIILCSISAWLYYGTDFLQPYLDDNSNFYRSMAVQMLVYGAHLLVPYAITAARGKLNLHKNVWPFLFFAFAGIVIFSFRSSWTTYYDWIYEWSAPENYVYNYRTLDDFIQMFILSIPLFVLWIIFHRNEIKGFYGFTAKSFKAKPYWIMLLVMVPLIAVASTQSDFLSTYPKWKKVSHIGLASEGINLIKYLFYEFCYGIDFVSIELFFRGFMILAFIRYAGPHCILPVASFYFAIHFGKPLGETISSFAGGTILGVMAYETRSIYGGIIVHMGIAWLMELGGTIGNLFVNVD